MVMAWSLLVLVGALAGADELGDELSLDLRKGKPDPALFEVIDDSSGEFITFTPTGMRMTLSKDQAKSDSRAMAFRFRLRGDFEITASYRILDIPKPAGKWGVGPLIGIRTDGRKAPAAMLYNALGPDGKRYYSAWHSVLQSAPKRKSDTKSKPASADFGRLRLERTGSTLAYLVAQEDEIDFREIRRVKGFGTDDVDRVRIRLAEGTEPNDIDVSWTDLSIRAKAFVGTGVMVTTIYGERIAGKPVAIDDESLLSQGTATRTTRLDEISEIRFDNEPTLAVQWIGQDGHDQVQVGAAEGGNGVQDMRLALTGLPSGRRIRQIMVVCRNPRRTGVWRLDPSRTTSWRIGLRRESEAETADLFLEPSSVDNNGQTFQVTVSFSDGGTANASVKATSATSDRLKVAGPGANDQRADKRPATPKATVLLDSGDELIGSVLRIDAERLKLAAAWSKEELSIPLSQVRGIRFRATAPDKASETFVRRLADPGDSDSVLLLDREGHVAVIEGSVRELQEGSLSVLYEAESRRIDVARVIGIVFGSRPARTPHAERYEVVQLANGDKITGVLAGVADDKLRIETPWGAAIDLPFSAIRSVTVRNGKMTYLSDLEPAAVEEVPYFGHRMPFRRDASLTGGPLLIHRRRFARGLAVHSRCVLTYRLDGRYDRFAALVGFDDATQRHGAVSCRVLGDDRELFVENDLRGDQPPRALDFSISGVELLSLEIDFGERENVGDRIIWANARVFRAKQSDDSGD